jgi:tetratricopeptide (TPR) repeat protein
MDGTTRSLVALLLVSLSGTACSFSQSSEATSVQLPEQPAVEASVDDQPPSLDVQFAMARTFEQERDLDRAAGVYRAILAQDSSHAGATHRLAIVCAQQGQQEESLKLFKRALELRPANADLYCDLGYSFYCRQQWGQAERNFRLALDAAPDHQRAHHHLGLTLAAQGKDGVALREFQKSGCSSAEARANLALMQTFTGRLEEAGRNCELARKADPRDQQVGAQLDEIEAVLAKTAPQPQNSPQVSEEIIVAGNVQADVQRQPESTPIWAVGFQSEPAAEPTPAAELTDAAAETSDQEPKQTTDDDSRDEQIEAVEEPATSPWRRLLKWRRADDAVAK